MKSLTCRDMLTMYDLAAVTAEASHVSGSTHANKCLLQVHLSQSWHHVRRHHMQRTPAAVGRPWSLCGLHLSMQGDRRIEGGALPHPKECHGQTTLSSKRALHVGHGSVTPAAGPLPRPDPDLVALFDIYVNWTNGYPIIFRGDRCSLVFQWFLKAPAPPPKGTFLDFQAAAQPHAGRLTGGILTQSGASPSPFKLGVGKKG